MNAPTTEQLRQAEQEYLALLQLPIGEFRCSMQEKLCELRDFITEATGQDGSEVQGYYAEKAMRMQFAVPELVGALNDVLNSNIPMMTYHARKTLDKWSGAALPRYIAERNDDMEDWQIRATQD